MYQNLSSYYPPGTSYFYAYPGGDYVSFHNLVPPEKEELVAARTLAIAGPSLNPIVFAASVQDKVCCFLNDDLRTPLVHRNQMIILPPEIDANLSGSERNEAIIKSLYQKIPQKTLVMAQPFLDSRTEKLFLISPELSVFLNDKKNMATYVPTENLPERYTFFSNGEELYSSRRHFPFPHVIKVSASSSGDGVRMCFSRDEYEAAKIFFRPNKGSILIEQYIPHKLSFGLQFAVPFDSTRSAVILGYNKQIVGQNGEYLAGVVSSERLLSDSLQNQVHDILLHSILPKVRNMGWFGVGAVDVVVGADGICRFIDPNFRLTAASPFIFFHINHPTQFSTLSFTASFPGTLEDFKDIVCAVAISGSPDQIMYINAITVGHRYHFSAGLLFDDTIDLVQRVERLLSLGVVSDRLSAIVQSLYRV